MKIRRLMCFLLLLGLFTSIYVVYAASFFPSNLNSISLGTVADNDPYNPIPLENISMGTEGIVHPYNPHPLNQFSLAISAQLMINPTIGEFSAPVSVGYGYYFFLVAIINDVNGADDFINATIQINGTIILKWDATTNIFSEYSDTSNYGVLDISGSLRENINSTAYRLKWKWAFYQNYPFAGLFIDVISNSTEVYDIYDYTSHGSYDNLFFYTGTLLPILQFEITNMDADNWIFSEEKYYNFSGIYMTENELQYYRFAFYDGTNWVNCTYTVSTDTTSITSGLGCVILGKTTYSRVGYITEATFLVYLTSDIRDRNNVDIYIVADDGTINWILIAPQYCNIYNIGGDNPFINLETGPSTVIYTTTGDASIESDAPSVNFGNITYTITGTLEADYSVTCRSLYGFNLGTLPVGTTVSSATLSLYYWGYGAGTNDPYGSGHYWDIVRITSAWSEYTVTWATCPTFSGEYERVSYPASYGWVNWTGSNLVSWVQGWMDGTYPKYGILLKIATENSAPNCTVFNYADEHIVLIAKLTITFSYPAGETGRIQGDYDVFSMQTVGGVTNGVMANYTWRNLAGIHMLVHVVPDYIGMYDGAWPIPNWNAFPYEWQIEYGTYYYVHGEWVKGWNCKIQEASGFVGPNDYWIMLQVDWYRGGIHVGNSEYFYSMWSGSSLHETTLWVDLWYGSANASSWGGGRVTAEYYGMTNPTGSWWDVIRHWFGSEDWTPMAENETYSQYYMPLLGPSGEVISTRDIELEQYYCKLSRSASSGTYTVKLKGYTVFDKHFTSIHKFVGIDNIPIVETKTKNMAQYNPGIVIAITGLLGRLLDYAIMGADWLLSRFFGMLGIDFTFSMMLAWLASLFTYLADAMTTFITTIGIIFQVITGPVVTFFVLLGAFVVKLLLFWSLLWGVFTGANPYISGFAEFFAQVGSETITWLVVIGYSVSVLDVAATKGIVEAYHFAALPFKMMMTVFDTVYKIARWVIEIVDKIISWIQRSVQIGAETVPG